MNITETAGMPALGEEPPLGPRLTEDGAHFNLFSNGEQVELILFDEGDDQPPSRTLSLEPGPGSAPHYWRCFVPGVRAGQRYGYRVHGAFTPERGLRFDPQKLLVDPYALCLVAPRGRSRSIDTRPGSNLATAFRSVIVDSSSYDWEGDRPPRIPYEKTVIYEMHVGNFTRHPSSLIDPRLRGTFAAVVQKIPYMLDLGVTAVELMPVFAFDEQAAPAGLRNVWGYEPLSFFAPHPGYSSRPDAHGVLDEFRDMVKALHRAGIEVLLDVVYNHSAEDDASGPTLSFRGLANDAYYMVAPDGTYANYSGTGNTLNASSAVVCRLIRDSLRYWVSQMHVDGFRFDLAAVFLRDERGAPLRHAPVLETIHSDPVLKDVKLVAEAWDAAGLSALGRFAHEGWTEWNGPFRDDVRRFLKSDSRTVQQIAGRLAGSPDIYQVQPRGTIRSINFVTSHDGFTLNDLVSYDGKHNEANGENNRDGQNDNYSWNCGAEGPSDEAQVNQLRVRQVKNFLTLTLLAAGTPMLLMGDELRRTQRGNNNGYCLDDETAWLDWGTISDHADVHRFTRQLIALRTGRAPFLRHLVGTCETALVARRMEWHGVRRGEPDWSDESHSLAVYIDYDACALYVILNAYWEPLSFEIPPPGAGRAPWRGCIDTFRAPPEDIDLGLEAAVVTSSSLPVQPRSVVVLVAATIEL